MPAPVSFDDEESSATPDPKVGFAKYEAFYCGYSTMDLVKAMDRVRNERDSIEREFKESGQEYDYLSKVAVPEKFAAEGIKNMNVDGIGLIKLTPDLYASTKAGMKGQLHEWLKDRGFGDLIQPQVPPSTLKAFLKSQIKAGKEFPDELVNITPFSRASITKK